MGSAREAFKQLLKNNGQSITKPRLRVFEALVNQESLSMRELTERVREVDRASVYRAIDLFEKLGVVQRLNTGWKYKIELSDKFAAHHHHLTCLHCGRTIPMNEDELESVIEKLAVSHHFKPTAHQIEIQGLCSGCQTQT